MDSLFFELGLVIISAAFVGVVSYFLRQPLILAYVAAGILIGPFGFGLIEDLHTIDIIAQVGIMLMLFLVGLEMNPDRLKNLGVVAFATGVGQALFTGLISYFIISQFGFSLIETIYLTIALTLSSTVIAVKLIYDKKDDDALYGQVAISILLVQDLIAILALLALNGFQAGSFEFDTAHFKDILIQGTLMAILTILIAKKLLVHLYKQIAESHELLILFSLSWCFLIALISEVIGFNVEIGAFIAGVSLASLPYTFEINAKAKVLRDFFITIFFVALGAGLVFSSVGPLVPIFIILSLFVIIGNPAIVMVIMGYFGYDKRTSFFTGISIANISEFSLIIGAMGLGLGHLSQEVFSMITLIGITTMTISSYFITYNNKLYIPLKNSLSVFEFKPARTKLKNIKKGMKDHIILLGAGRMGEQILDQIRKFKEEYIVVDHDNAIITNLIEQKVSCIFGSIEDPEIIREINLSRAEMIISTLTDSTDNLFLIKYIETLPAKKRPIVIVTADSGREGMQLFNRGADYVILKPYLGAEHINQVNRELYALKNITPAGLIKNGKKGPKGEKDFAQILQGLNQVRLAEIKKKIKNRHIKLKRKTK